MATTDSEPTNFGTLGRSGNTRHDLTLEQARIEVAADLDHGIITEVVRYLPTGFIDEHFFDDPVVVADKLTHATARIEKLTLGIRELIDLHHVGYGSVSEEAYGNNPFCAECGQSYPCDTRSGLEGILRN